MFLCSQLIDNLFHENHLICLDLVIHIVISGLSNTNWMKIGISDTVVRLLAGVVPIALLKILQLT